MSSWRAGFRRLGGPDAVSWPLFWVTFASNLIGHFVTPGQTDATPAVRVLAVVCSQVALFIPLLLARATVLSDPARPHPWLAVTAFVAAIFTRTAALAWVLYAVAGITTPPYLQRVLGVFFQLFLTLLLTALVVTAQREHARDLASLAQVRSGIEQTMTRVLGQVEERNEDALRRVSHTLDEELAALEVTADDDAVAAPQRLASDVVRPMSHELASAAPEWAVVVDDGVRTDVGWTEAARALGVRGHFLPEITAAIITLVMLVPSLIYFPGARWAVLAGSAVGTWVAFRVGNALLDRMLPLASSRGSLVVVVLVAVFCGAVPAGVVGLAIRGLSGSVIAFGGAAFVAVVALMAALTSALLSEQRRVAAELAESTQQLRATLVRLHQVEWFQQKSLSRALHGPVQSAVTAAALRLDGAVRSGTATPELVAGVRASLRGAIDVLHVPDLQPMALDDYVARLSGTWDGVCQVQVKVDPAARGALADDPILRSTVTEAITEAVSNSVRHAQARTAIVELRRVDDMTLALLVANDGTASPTRAAAGMGSRFLDECTLSWDLQECESGWRLEVLVPTTLAS